MICSLVLTAGHFFIFSVDAGWEQHFHDETHTGYTDISLDPNHVMWIHEFNVDKDSTTDCSPVIYQDRVIIAHQKTLYALDIETGEEIWDYSDGSFIGWWMAADNGIIVIEMSNGFMYGISTDGTELWKIFLESGSGTIFEGRVYTGGPEDLYCVDLYTGAIVSTYHVGYQVESPSILKREVIVFGTDDPCEIHAVDINTMQSLWVHPTQDEKTMGPPACDGDILYVSTFRGDEATSSNVGTLTALSSKGILIWEFSENAILTKPIVSGYGIFTGMMDWSSNDRDDLRIFMLNTVNGEIIWEYETICGAAGSLSGDQVYLGVLPHGIIGLDKGTGELKWEYGHTGDEWGISPSCTPAISHDSVFMGGLGSRLFRFDHREPPGKMREHFAEQFLREMNYGHCSGVAIIIGITIGIVIREKVIGKSEISDRIRKMVRK